MDGYLGQMPTGGRLGGKGNLPFETLLACSELFSRHLSAKLQHNAITLLPALLHADWTRARLWSGLHPATPDKTPILGPDARFPGLWWAIGVLSRKMRALRFEIPLNLPFEGLEGW